MGNTNSTPRGQPDDGQLEELSHTRNDRLNAEQDAVSRGRTARLARRNTHSLRAAGQRASILYDSLRRQRPVEPTQVAATSSSSSPRPSADIEYEQENRPLVGGQEVEPNASQVSSASENTSRQRSSMISRLRLSILSDPLVRGRFDRGDEHLGEEPTLRNMADRFSTARDDLPPAIHNIASNSRVSLIAPQTEIDGHGSPPRPGEPSFSLMHDYRHPQTRDPEPSSFDAVREISVQGSLPILRSRNRLSRVRDSISLSSRISSLLGRPSEQFQSNTSLRESTSRTARVTFAEDSDRLLPSSENRHDHDDQPHELDAVEAETRTGPSTPRVASGLNSTRRFQPGLRSRSTRLIRRGEHPPLSQVLQLAAAAIAAQLSGHASGSHPGARGPSGETFDGSIQNFVQTLQDAATAQAGENVGMSSADGDLPPVNFMRVFQFPNDENGSPIASQAQSRDVGQMDLDSIASPEDTDRSVTLVLVGVRSLPHGQDTSNGENGLLGPSLDTLLSLPFLPPANMLRNGSSGALFRRSDASGRRSNPRRHSMTNYSFPSQYESQRHQRTRNATGRSSSGAESAVNTDPSATTPLVSESPPGPHPPPSTPADIRSGQVSPARRPSSASAVTSSYLPDSEDLHRPQSPDEDVGDQSFNTARQRRRSDSEFARRPELGSGAARRNGMVEPDHPPAGVGRSWLIYVVGTNVSPDHPAFTMPSLFTDNPSYEDMQMLSTLLGPVKPPVATEDEVNAAGGLFRLQESQGILVGRSITRADGESFTIAAGERCLICLSDYAASEEVRRLGKCSHLYHRECIDEVRVPHTLLRW